MYEELFYKMKPDFNELINIIKGKTKSNRVHLVELGIDLEVMEYIWKNHLNKEWLDDPTEIIKERIEFFYSLGYDFITFWPTIRNIPEFKKRSSWKDFKSIEWDKLDIDMKEFEIARNYIETKKGMKLMLSTTLFEMVLERWMGYEGLFVSLVQHPDLVEAVFNVWGEKIYEFYERLIDDETVGGIFHADDMGFKSSTMISLKDLRKYVFPWLKRYADLAHSKGKVFFLHSCGNNQIIMEDLINYIGIDAYHSFEDAIIPIWEFQRKYPNIGALGGVDVDKLSRYSKTELRNYVKEILKKCISNGKFALGAGNTVTNYVPPENYLTMVEMARNFKV